LRKRRGKEAETISISAKVDVGAETRRRAREKVGLPPTEKIIPDKRRKPPKHKRKLIDEELG
jgi:hypothetical protein